MRIPITCGSCGRDFSAPSSHAGRKVVCPECGQGVKVKNSGIATPEDANGSEPKRSVRRERGQGANPKVVLAIIGVAAAALAVGVGMKNLPSLSEMNAVVMTPPAPPPQIPPTQPAPSAAQPIPTKINPVPTREPAGAAPARPFSRERDEEFDQASADDVRRKPLFGSKESDRFPAEKARHGNAESGQTDLARQTDESEEERVQRLLSQLDEVVLVREDLRNARQFDPRGALWRKIESRAEVTITKMGLEFSTNGPRRDAAMLKVDVRSKPTPVGTPGTQEFKMSAELVCIDPDGAGVGKQPVTLWSHEASIGTMARRAMQTGKVPDSVDRNIAAFFSQLRQAHRHASNELETTEDDDVMVGEDDAEMANEPDDAADDETAPEAKPDDDEESGASDS